jgi:hypothetical protein
MFLSCLPHELKQSGVDCIERELKPAVGIQFGIYAFDMGSNRIFADEHGFRDFIIAFSLTYQPEYLKFCRRELI